MAKMTRFVSETCYMGCGTWSGVWLIIEFTVWTAREAFSFAD